jgi:hypothetical protein
MEDNIIYGQERLTVVVTAAVEKMKKELIEKVK